MGPSQESYELGRGALLTWRVRDGCGQLGPAHHVLGLRLWSLFFSSSPGSWFFTLTSLPLFCQGRSFWIQFTSSGKPTLPSTWMGWDLCHAHCMPPLTALTTLWSLGHWDFLRHPISAPGSCPELSTEEVCTWRPGEQI